MIKFEQMTYGKTVFGSKSAKLTSFDNDKLHSPYNGEVVKTHHHQCNTGYLLIKHTIGKDVYYSQFCGIKRPVIALKDYIKAGKTIGYFSNDEIVYSLLDSNFKTINPEPPFVTGFKEPKDKEKEKDKDPKNYEPKTPASDSKIDSLVSLSLLPLEIVSDKIVDQGKKLGKNLKNIGKSMFQLHDKEKDEKIKKAKGLTEDIERIKKLLK